MSWLLGERSRQESRSTISLSQYARLISSGASVAGVSVDQDSALRHDAVWSCVTKKAQDVAMLPADVVRYQQGKRIPVEPAPQIIAAPSVMLRDPMDWRYQVMVSWLTAGRAWGNITQVSSDGRYPTRIELLNDADVQVVQMGSDVQIMVHGEKRDLWPVGDLWYEPAYTIPGRFLGMSPIAYHARTIGVGLGAEKFAGDYYAAGMHPTHIFKMPGQPTEDQAKDFKARILDVMRGNREPLVVPMETVIEKMQLDPAESQFIDAQKYTVEQICRIYDEDPADHGSSGGGSALTYANRSDSDLARLRRRQFWVTKLQNCLTAMLPRPQVVKLNTSALLMMTTKERWQIHDLRLKNKTQSINGVLKIEDEEPFPDDEYDEPGIPGGNPPETPVVKVEEGT